MKKLIIIAIILTASTTYAQTFTVDPNSVIVTNGSVTVNLTLTISADQKKAMLYKGFSFDDVIKRMSIKTFYKRIVDEYRLALIANIPIAELEELE